MAILEDRIGQGFFLNPAEMVPEDHICRLVDAIVGEIDVSRLEQRYRCGPGNPAYPRRMLLRLMVQAAIDGVESSRRIEKLARENVIYIHLTGNRKPDFVTLCNFRRRNGGLIEDVFKKVVSIALALGIADLGHLSTDGSKIKAAASNGNVLSKEQLDWIKEIIERGIKVDEEENEKYGERRGDELPPGLNTREKIRQKIREIEEAKGKKMKSGGKGLIERHALGNTEQKQRVEKLIEKASEELEKSGQSAASLTDPEARFMKNKKGRIELSYNPQITVDVSSGIILANDVVQEPTDISQMIPQIEETEANVGKLPEGTKLSNDNGYYSGPNLHYLEGRKFDAYIPDKGQASEMKGRKRNNPYSKDRFEYDPGKDCFICPRSETLPLKGTYEYGGRLLRTYYGAGCRECPARSKCTKGRYRMISSYGHEAEKRRMAAKMKSEGGKQEYAKRVVVERPFGDIKQNQGLREFLTRGVGNVKAEFDLASTAHNLKRIWSEVGRDLDVIKLAIAILSGAAPSGGAGSPPPAKSRLQIF